MEKTQFSPLWLVDRVPSSFIHSLTHPTVMHIHSHSLSLFVYQVLLYPIYVDAASCYEVGRRTCSVACSLAPPTCEVENRDKPVAVERWGDGEIERYHQAAFSTHSDHQINPTKTNYLLSKFGLSNKNSSLDIQ